MKNCFRIAAVLMAAALVAGSFQEAAAESRSHRDSTRFEVRLGWGDQMFESLIWQNAPYIITNMDESYTRTYKEHYRYSQHWFADFSWRVNGWFGIGATLDASGCSWDEVTRNGLGTETARSKGHDFWNLTMMPTFRFTWLNTRYVSLYSSLGAGLGLNGGSETDAKGHHTLCGLAVDLVPIGMTVDWNDWCVFAQLGGLSSVRNIKTTVFMLNSRIVSVGIGYRF